MAAIENTDQIMDRLKLNVAQLSYMVWHIIFFFFYIKSKWFINCKYIYYLLKTRNCDNKKIRISI